MRSKLNPNTTFSDVFYEYDSPDVQTVVRDADGGATGFSTMVNPSKRVTRCVRALWIYFAFRL